MSTFPRLKTGAVTQYPAGRSAGHATAVFRFLDGTEQRFRCRAAGSKRWAIRLALLDDNELAEIAEFFESQMGRFGAFAFEDPWEGTVHPDCSFENGTLELQLSEEGRGSVQLVIRENE